jgi:preprotein translocase subunit SecE
MEEGEVADKNRGRSVADGDDSADDGDDEFDAVDGETDDAEDVDDEDDADERSAKSRRAATAGAASRTVTRRKIKEDKGVGVFGRLGRFVREVVAELQKVIWPTRKELLTYTTVVVVFVAIMMTFVSLLDVGFAKLMFLVFGSGTSDAAPQ